MVVAVSALEIIEPSVDLTEESESPRFVSTLTALAGKAHRSSGKFERILTPVGEDICFTQKRQDERAGDAELHGLAGAQRRLQQQDTLSHPPREGIGVAQTPRVKH